MKKYIFTVLLTLIFSHQTIALGIDNMILISGQDKQGDFYNIVNDTEVPVYVKTEISEVNYVNGKNVESIYTRDNLKLWNITVNPNLYILDSKVSKKVSVNMIDKDRIRERDEIYTVSFLPQPYITDEKKVNQMSMQIGFKAYYILPAQISDVKYSINYDKKTGVLTVDNTGNTLIVVELNMCNMVSEKESQKQLCEASFLAPSGRKKNFEVPAVLRQKTMRFEITNHNRSYRKSQIF
ncbi:hypothetical protein AAHK27_002597 [Salmonella enterica]